MHPSPVCCVLYTPPLTCKLCVLYTPLLTCKVCCTTHLLLTHNVPPTHPPPGDPTVPMTLAASIVLYISASMVLVLGVCRLVLEFLQAFKRRHHYFLNIENYIEDVTYVFAIIFVIQFGMNCWCPTSWQWQLGALSVFFAWINLILFLKSVPLLGIYVLMYTTIMYTFFRVMVIAFLFVIAFSLAFYMILYRAVLVSHLVWCLLFNCPGCVFLRWVLQLVGTRSLWRDCVCLVMSVESYSGFRTTPNVLIEHFHIPVTVVYVYNVCMCLCTCTCVCVIWWVCYLSSRSSIGYTHNNIGCVNHLVGVSIIWWVCPSCGVCP